jgi:hypothetical protein
VRASTKKLLMYGGIAAAAYYFFIKPTPVPAAAAALAPAAPGVAGLGYFPSGSDRPFARAYNGAPSAWWSTHRW